MRENLRPANAQSGVRTRHVGDLTLRRAAPTRGARRPEGEGGTCIEAIAPNLRRRQ
jgi:hypothetical protein